MSSYRGTSNLVAAASTSMLISGPLHVANGSDGVTRKGGDGRGGQGATAGMQSVFAPVVGGGIC
jgi:hypothetical protein